MKRGGPGDILRRSPAVPLIAAFFASAALWSLRGALLSDQGPAGFGSITAYERRFDGIKKSLPPRGVVGYVSFAPPERMYVESEAGTAYFLSQYSLAPLIVRNEYDRDLVVGNFHRRDQSPPPEAGGLAVVKDFGNGVLLLAPAR